MVKTLLPAALLAAGLTTSLGTPAQAVPLAPIATPSADIVQVYDGCGPYGHRGPYGGCRRGGQDGGYIRGRACPPGWHIGPYGHHCLRNR